MAQHQRIDPAMAPVHQYQRAPKQTAWVGWVFFAGIIMLLAGAFNTLAGVVALINDDYYYLVGPEGLIVEVDYTAWGWTLLIYGVVVCLAGVGILVGQTWARVVGVLLAAVNALVNLGFLAAYPIWSTIIIALDILVIYALIVHGREARSDP